MATANDKKADVEDVTSAALAAPAESEVTGAEADRHVRDFFDHKLTQGINIRFESRQGDTVAVVTKSGNS